ncbi:indole-3-glycerol phosphate synthase TrpC [Garciella nitratireducens]|uniref:indole-3-glycerol phosphate synthase TrpC n=1 Tax=Garciella nitratireducens TaxID=218205 RepID=UPI000DE94A55|nr:indole-3-glycerol phosphate synthase TrpC [Garciella nitratireducens]RBP46910.1 indole-3-glycerol phosphate synthase [Garciella nitratireducens]
MILDEIVKVKRKQLEKEKSKQSLKELIKKLEDREIRNFQTVLLKKNLSIIAEIKKASPSKGVLIEEFDFKKISKIYQELCVDAISVLTESHFFKGKKEYIKEVKAITNKPILRKDFIIDEYQIYQSFAIGADAILLIAAILPGKLKPFYQLASRLGLHVLIEVHNLEELQEALKTGGDMIGINNRDLKTFKVNLQQTQKLIREIPKNKIIVSESGISTEKDINKLKDLGVDAILVGETFMKNINDREKINAFLKACKEDTRNDKN